MTTREMEMEMAMAIAMEMEIIIAMNVLRHYRRVCVAHHRQVRWLQSSISNSSGSNSDVSGGAEALDTPSLTPQQVVAELNKHVVGQHDAKKAVAIALRERWRRQKLPTQLQKEGNG